MRSAFAGLLLAGAMSVGAATASTTYTMTQSAAGDPSNATACPAGQCANYAAHATLSASFTVPNPLAPNLNNVEIGPTVTAYTFTDPLQTITNTDPLSRKVQFTVSTNGSGAITDININVQQWQNSVHAASNATNVASNRYNEIVINGDGGLVHNQYCTRINNVSASGDADTCAFDAGGAAQGVSEIFGFGVGTWTAPQPANVPTLSEQAALILASLIGGAGILLLMRRRIPLGRTSN